MRIEQLEYFVQTASASSLNKAGEQLHITQQSLNAALKKLEEELGTTLLDRDYSGIQLNEQGKIALPYMEEILQLVHDMKTALNSTQKKKVPVHLKGSLTIHTTMAPNHALLPRAIQEIMEQNENISFKLLEKDKEEIFNEVMQNLPVLGIVSHIPEYEDMPDDILDGDFYLQKVAFAKVYAVVGQSHPLAQQKSVTIRTILKYPLGIVQSDSHPISVQKILEEKGTPNIQLITNSLQTYRRTIDSGQIIGFNPYMNFKNSLNARQGVVYLPIRDFPQIEVYLITNKAYYDENNDLIDALSLQISKIVG